MEIAYIMHIVHTEKSWGWGSNYLYMQIMLIVRDGQGHSSEVKMKQK